MVTPASARYALLAGLLVAPIVACQFLVSSDVVQCNKESDCTSRGGDFFAGSTCVSNVCVPSDASVDAPSDVVASDAAAEAGDDGGPFGCTVSPYPEENPLHPVTYTRAFQNVALGTALTKIGVQVCSIIDPNCLTPRVQADGGFTVIPDDNGSITVNVDFGFNGLLQVTDLVPEAGVVTPALIQVTPPVLADAAVGPAALMVSPGTFDDVATQVFGDAGVVDPNLAHLFFRTHDCHDKELAGIYVDTDRVDRSTRPFYFTNGIVPDPNAVQTDNGAKGGILNLPPGTVIVTGHFYDTHGKLGSVAVKLRAGFITYVIITPTE